MRKLLPQRDLLEDGASLLPLGAVEVSIFPWKPPSTQGEARKKWSRIFSIPKGQRFGRRSKGTWELVANKRRAGDV